MKIWWLHSVDLENNGTQAETLLPWKEYCHDLNQSEMVHISRAKIVCKMHTAVYLFDGCSNEFKHHHLVSKNHTF